MYVIASHSPNGATYYYKRMEAGKAFWVGTLRDDMARFQTFAEANTLRLALQKKVQLPRYLEIEQVF
jgi:hypothetical protein